MLFVSVKNPGFCKVPTARTNVVSCLTYLHYFLGTVFLAVFPNHLGISPFLVINIALHFFFLIILYLLKMGLPGEKKFCQHIDSIKGEGKKIQLVSML